MGLCGQRAAGRRCLLQWLKAELMGLKILEVDKLQCGEMAGFENDFRRASGVKRFLPAFHAKTPAVAMFETGKCVFGAGGGEVVSA